MKIPNTCAPSFNPTVAPNPELPPSVVAGEGVVRTINPNAMITTTGDSIGSAFKASGATGEVGTVTVVIS